MSKTTTAVLLQPEKEIPVKDNALLVAVKESGLEQTKAQRFLDMFTPYLNRMSEIELKINSLNSENPQKEDVSMARNIRLALKDNRVASEKVRKGLKESVLVEGKLIDNMNGVIENTSKTLEAQCEKIEKDAEIKEAARVEAIRSERAKLLAVYVEDPNIFPLGKMSVSEFDNMLSGYKLAKEEKERDAARAEAERLEREAEEEAERERVRLENEKLKAEAEEKDRIYNAERAAAARIANAEAAKQAEELRKQQEKAKKATAEAEKLKRELKAKEEAEAAEQRRLEKEAADKLAAEKKAAKAPVKTRMKSAIDAMVLQLPESDVTEIILSKHQEFKKWALTKIESL